MKHPYLGEPHRFRPMLPILAHFSCLTAMMAKWNHPQMTERFGEFLAVPAWMYDLIMFWLFYFPLFAVV